MSKLPQYSSEFAKDIQYFINIDEIGYAREDLLNPENFSKLWDMPLDDRYNLIQWAILIKPIMDRDDPLSVPYDEFVAFMLMSIPYEPLFENEYEDARIIADIIKGYDWEIDISIEKKLNICRAIKDIYLNIYKVKEEIPIGMIWPQDNAPKETLNYMSRLHAVFCPYSTEHLRESLNCETDLKKSNSPSIAFTKAVVLNTHILDLIVITLHEIRHFSQVKIKTPQVARQDSDLVNHLTTSRTRNAYYGLMNERQANIFMGRVEDLVKGTKIRSEVEISSQMLSTKQHGRLSRNLAQAILNYNDFVTYSKRRHPQTKIRNPAVAQKPTPHPA